MRSSYVTANRDGRRWATHMLFLWLVAAVPAAAAWPPADTQPATAPAPAASQPTSTSAPVADCGALLDAADWAAARACAEQLLAAQPELAAARLVLAQAAAGLDDNDAAREAFKAAVAADPNNVPGLLAYADFSHRTGDLLAAQRYYQAAWTLAPANAEALESLVACYLEAGKREIAADILRQAETAQLPDDVLRRIGTALEFAAQPMSADHIAALERQFADHPDDWRTGLQLAAGLFLQERYDDSFRVAQQVRAARPDEERLLYLLAHIYRQRLDFAAAADILRGLVRKYPNRVTALTQLADILSYDFQIDAARDLYRRILQLHVTPSETGRQRVALLTSYLNFGEFDAALDAVQRWSAADPNGAEWGRTRLQVLQAAGRHDQAIALATQRLNDLGTRLAADSETFRAEAAELREHPDDPGVPARVEQLQQALSERLTALRTARADFVQACLAGRAYTTAEKELRAWLAEDEDDQDIRTWLVGILLADERPAGALEVLGGMRPTSKADLYDVYILRAQAHAADDRLDAAVQELNELLAEPFTQSDAAAQARVRQVLIQLLVDGDDLDQARELCATWFAAADNPLVARSVLRIQRFVSLAAGDEDAALAIGERLLADEPYDAGLCNDVGYTLAERGTDLDRALVLVRRAVAAEPLQHAFLDSLGWVYYKLGDFAAAQRYLSRAVRLHAGQEPVLYDHLGDAAYRTGDQQLARESWERSRALLDAQDPAERVAEHTRLLATLRAKLDALSQQQPAPVAPTALEQPPTDDHAAEDLS